MYHKLQLSSLFRSLLAPSRTSSYVYKPLAGAPDAIRLILLQPAPSLSSPISCRIIETSRSAEQIDHTQTFKHSPQNGYTALSYTWGSTIQRTPIEINNRPFRITPNLYNALQHLRSQEEETRVWADSLCINQQDVEERNLHVSQMREIYSVARETITFLGEATPGSDAILTAINDAAGAMSDATTQIDVVRCLASVSGLRKSALAEEASRILWRPYWKRIWIFQEIVVSENPWVQCGSIRVPWESFCRATIALLTEDKMWGGGYGNEAKMRLENVYRERKAWRAARGIGEQTPTCVTDGQDPVGRMGLLDLLVTKRGSEASDERDMVFAVSGIATVPASGKPLAITYEKSAARVYVDTVKHLLAHDGNYEILSHTGQHKYETQTHQTIPSWAPDWRVRSSYRTRIVNWLPLSPASPDLIARNHAFLPNYDVLVCAGFKIGTIINIGADISAINPAKGSIGRIIWDQKNRRRQLHRDGVLSDYENELGTVFSFISRRHPVTHKRKLADLEGGVLALVPMDAREGDVVGWFFGGTVPFVLRRVENGAWMEPTSSNWTVTEKEVINALEAKNADTKDMDVEHYTFIGECYVDGYMGSKTQEQDISRAPVAFVLR